MRKNNKGFTLLELLIAATIIGILAVLATVSFRNSAGDTRVAGAKAKLNALGGAVQRFKLDPQACPEGYLSINSLVSCGFLEVNNFNEDTYFSYAICETSPGSCPSSSYLACMTGRSSKLPKRYLGSSGYSYCWDSTGVTHERMGTN